MYFKPMSALNQGRIQPEVEGGGAIWRGGAKNIMKGQRIQENSLVLLNNALVYMFLRIQNETLKKVHLGQDKGRCSSQKGGAKAELSS